MYTTLLKYLEVSLSCNYWPRCEQVILVFAINGALGRTELHNVKFHDSSALSFLLLKTKLFEVSQ
jgi:hypothetical protein